MGYAATSYHQLHQVPAISPAATEQCDGSEALAELQGVPVIGFDMGGTSTDVSRYSGSFEHVFESSISGITLQSPQVTCSS